MDKPPRRRPNPNGPRRSRARAPKRGELPGPSGMGSVTMKNVTPARRGPGRPKTSPTSGRKSFRSAPRPRKPAGPLVVPLGQSPAPTPPGRSPAMSPAPPERGLGFYQPMNDDV